MASSRQGIQTTRLPLPDIHSTQLARNVASVAARFERRTAFGAYAGFVAGKVVVAADALRGFFWRPAAGTDPAFICHHGATEPAT